MASLFDQIPVPELHCEKPDSLDEILETEREVSNRTRRLTVKQFCLSVLHSREYREALVRRIDSDQLPAQVETMMWHFAYGKPVERVEINDVTENRFANIKDEDLDARLQHLILEKQSRLRQLEQKPRDTMH